MDVINKYWQSLHFPTRPSQKGMVQLIFDQLQQNADDSFQQLGKNVLYVNGTCLDNLVPYNKCFRGQGRHPKKSSTILVFTSSIPIIWFSINLLCWSPAQITTGGEVTPVNLWKRWCKLLDGNGSFKFNILPKVVWEVVEEVRTMVTVPNPNKNSRTILTIPNPNTNSRMVPWVVTVINSNTTIP